MPIPHILLGFGGFYPCTHTFTCLIIFKPLYPHGNMDKLTTQLLPPGALIVASLEERAIQSYFLPCEIRISNSFLIELVRIR